MASFDRGRILFAGAAWLSAFVGLWSLSGCCAILLYRDNQMSSHHCLRGLTLPEGYLHVGLISLVLSAALGLFALRARKYRRARLRRSAMFGAAALGPLVLVTIVLYNTAAPPHPARDDACTGTFSDYYEDLR